MTAPQDKHERVERENQQRALRLRQEHLDLMDRVLRVHEDRLARATGADAELFRVEAAALRAQIDEALVEVARRLALARGEHGDTKT